MAVGTSCVFRYVVRDHSSRVRVDLSQLHLAHGAHPAALGGSLGASQPGWSVGNVRGPEISTRPSPGGCPAYDYEAYEASSDAGCSGVGGLQAQGQGAQCRGGARAASEAGDAQPGFPPPGVHPGWSVPVLQPHAGPAGYPYASRSRATY